MTTIEIFSIAESDWSRATNRLVDKVRLLGLLYIFLLQAHLVCHIRQDIWSDRIYKIGIELYNFYSICQCSDLVGKRYQHLVITLLYSWPSIMYCYYIFISYIFLKIILVQQNVENYLFSFIANNMNYIVQKTKFGLYWEAGNLCISFCLIQPYSFFQKESKSNLHF